MTKQILRVSRKDAAGRRLSIHICSSTFNTAAVTYRSFNARSYEGGQPPPRRSGTLQVVEVVKTFCGLAPFSRTLTAFVII